MRNDGRLKAPKTGNEILGKHSQSARQQNSRILVMGAGTGRANNLISSLRAGQRELCIHGCHHDPFMLAKSTADEASIVPDPSSELFPDTVRNLVHAEGIDLIIPSSEPETLAVARAREILRGVTYLPPTSLIEICQDKYELTEAMSDAGIPVPTTFALATLDDVPRAFEALGNPAMAWCRTRTGAGSRAATKVKSVEQALNWIRYWNDMRGTNTEEFTLSEYLPGRDFNVQAHLHEGRTILIKMCERLTYLDGGNRPSGTSSTPAVAKTIRDDQTLDMCEAALAALDSHVSGIFSIDIKQDPDGISNITEINAGRFAMITNFYDFTGTHNMAETYVSFALGERPSIADVRDFAPDYYLIRDHDTLPSILSLDEVPL